MVLMLLLMLGISSLIRSGYIIFEKQDQTIRYCNKRKAIIVNLPAGEKNLMVNWEKHLPSNSMLPKPVNERCQHVLQIDPYLHFGRSHVVHPVLLTFREICTGYQRDYQSRPIPTETPPPQHIS